MAYPCANSNVRLVTDASDCAMGAALEQFEDNTWRLLAFFSRKLTKAEKKYTALYRELAAIYFSLKKYAYYLRSIEFIIYTDHKPLTFALSKDRADEPKIRTRRLDYISTFNTQIKTITGKDNAVADALSRIEIDSIEIRPIFTHAELSEAQQEDVELKKILEDKTQSLKLTKIILGKTLTPIYCNMHDNIIRPFLPEKYRMQIFLLYHNKAHPSTRVTDRLIRQNYVWPNMHSDITRWTKTCIACQKSKITRGDQFIPSKFAVPDARFRHIHLDIVGKLPISNGYEYILREKTFRF